ncbi:MAG: hypothetical protein JXB33_00065 [Clostridia bacterium]|nr:hypothetical protein [Clostridia bacterium]
MDKGALQKILEAERQADEILAEGVRKARETADRSASDLKRLNTEYEELLDKETGRIIAEKIKEAEAQVEKLEASFIDECAKIRKDAESNITEAVEYVIGKIGDGKWQ